MKSFTEVLEEAAGKGLTVFDIDDTLLVPVWLKENRPDLLNV